MDGSSKEEGEEEKESKCEEGKGQEGSKEEKEKSASEEGQEKSRKEEKEKKIALAKHADTSQSGDMLR